MGDVPCNENSVQDVTAISGLCSVCVTPTELYGTQTTFHRGVVNTVPTTRRATQLPAVFFIVVIFNTGFNKNS